jgi:hypothetical protein
MNCHYERRVWREESAFPVAGVKQIPRYARDDNSTQVLAALVLTIQAVWLRNFYCARNTPPSDSSLAMICADHCATSSSRRVRSFDWNSAWRSTEYLPMPTFSPR